MTDEQIIANRFGRFGKKEVKQSTSNLAVMYTRVSGKGQFDKNESLETQRKSIEEYAKRNNLTIVSAFGDTYESAKTDARKEFQRMLSFVNTSKGKISTILVYKMTRFSRTGGKAISIADELREKHGVHIKAVTEPIDTSNPNGVLFHDMQLLFGRWDNEQRKQVAMAGMKAKFEKGIWVVKPPQGYDIVRTNGERKIVVNADGKKIKKAWEWKLMGMKNEEIILKLQSIGVKMYKQQLHKIFINPFYCGLVSHGMLNGKVVEGVHEKMISKETFMKVNEVISSSTKFGVPHKAEDVNIPLKVLIKCSDCNQPFTGYIVKKKNLYYYKCRTNGCKCNKSAKEMHRLFSEELEKYEVKPDLSEAIKIELESTYHELNKDSVEKEAILKARIVELTKDIETLEEKHYIKEEMPKETYDRFRVKYTKEFDKIRKEMATCGISISNLKEMINEAVILCRNLRQLWQDGGIALKEGLQNLLFPSGLVYDKKTGAFRTSEINFIIAQIARHTGDFAIIKKGLSSLFEPKSLCAERTLPSSNLKPLNELETSRLEKAISPHKIPGLNDEALADVFLQDLAAINEFLFYVEAEPFVTPEKAENHKRVAFKKVQAA